MRYLFIFIWAILAQPFGETNEYSDQIYSQIRDICHPTRDDYLKIQQYLSSGTIPLIDRLDEWQYRAKLRNFRFVGDNPYEIPEYGVIPVNCDENNKENCVLLFSSFNYEYPAAIRRMIEIIKASDFKGHILYRIGGWPDLEGGSLVLAHIPFSFKICFFREAERLGYKRALWLDSSIIPLTSLNTVFEAIQTQGVFTFRSPFNVQQLSNPYACAAMNVSFEEAELIPGCLAGIAGFDFYDNRGKEALALWYEYTKNREEASFSLRQEFCVMSVVLYQLGLTDSFPYMTGRVTWDKNETSCPGVDFFVDKYFVQPRWPN